MTFFKMIKVISFATVITIVLIFFSFWSNLPVIINIIIFDVFFIIFFTLILTFIFNLKIRKKEYNDKTSLYKWMDELPDRDNHLLANLNSSIASYKTLENLTRLKEIVKKRTNGNLEALKLYKVFYVQSSKEKMEDLYFKSVLLLFPTIGFYLIRDFIPESESSNGNTIFLTMVFILVTIIMISDKLSYNKRRIGLLIEIIDICIEEALDDKGKAGGKNYD